MKAALIRGAVAAGLVLLLATGCGDSDDDASKGTAPAGEGTTTTAVADGEPSTTEGRGAGANTLVTGDGSAECLQADDLDPRFYVPVTGSDATEDAKSNVFHDPEVKDLADEHLEAAWSVLPHGGADRAPRSVSCRIYLFDSAEVAAQIYDDWFVPEYGALSAPALEEMESPPDLPAEDAHAYSYRTEEPTLRPTGAVVFRVENAIVAVRDVYDNRSVEYYAVSDAAQFAKIVHDRLTGTPAAPPEDDAFVEGDGSDLCLQDDDLPSGFVAIKGSDNTSNARSNVFDDETVKEIAADHMPASWAVLPAGGYGPDEWSATCTVYLFDSVPTATTVYDDYYAATYADRSSPRPDEVTPDDDLPGADPRAFVKMLGSTGSDRPDADVIFRFGNAIVRVGATAPVGATEDEAVAGVVPLADAVYDHLVEAS